MNTTQISPRTTNQIAADLSLLPDVVAPVEQAGAALLKRVGTASPPADVEQIRAALGANDDAVLETLRAALLEALPAAGWDEEEGGAGALPPGEWWVVDPVEGNINHAHGLDDWGVTATLVRDNASVLTVVHQPQHGRMYTAVQGAGAALGERTLRVSSKTDLATALVGTGQAVPGESRETYERIGHSVTAMLRAALVVKVAVPATLHLLDVAAGRTDVFWQHSQVRSGLLAGALLVSEAGGTVTDMRGEPWTLASEDFLAASPGVHHAAAGVLAGAEPGERGGA